MKKYVIFSLALIFAMVLPMLVQSVAYAANPGQPNEGTGNTYLNLIEDTISGGGPATVDPAGAYDTASGGLLLNVYDTMLFYAGEQVDQFVPKLATQCYVGPPAAGAPAYTNFTVYFTVRSGVNFHTSDRVDDALIGSWAQYTLHPYDIEYSFERIMVHDYSGGPQWMIYEPLTATWASESTAEFGTRIDNSVESNATSVWFNIANVHADGTFNNAPATATFNTFVPMFYPNGTWRSDFYSNAAALPTNYPMRIFLMEFSQTWGSILSRDWVRGWLNPWFAAHPQVGMNASLAGDWPGEDFSEWMSYRAQVNSSPFVLDLVGNTVKGVTCGTGPYRLDTYNPAQGGSWTGAKYDGYWEGFPSATPDVPYGRVDKAGIHAKGWVDSFTIRQVPTAALTADMQSGQCDFSAIPRSLAGNMHVGGDRNGVTMNITAGDGTPIRLDYPTYALSIDSYHFCFNVTNPKAGDPYGKLNAPGVITEDGVPQDFYSDKNVRLAVAHLLNYSAVILTQYFGEGYQPRTFCPDGMLYTNASIPKYSMDLAAATAELNAAWGGQLATTGFTVVFNYNSGNVVRQAYTEQMRDALNSLGNPKWHAVSQGNVWGTMLHDMNAHALPSWGIGWLADYADIHNFAFTYVDSAGSFAFPQNYINAAADAALARAIREPDGPLRQADYNIVQQIYYNDVVSLPVSVLFGRHYEQWWMNGWYANPLLSDNYAYQMWEWNYVKGDINRDAKVDMGDITTTLLAFGSYYGSGSLPVIHPRWNLWCDVNGSPRAMWEDRKIDIGDVVNILPQFGRTGTQWSHP